MSGVLIPADGSSQLEIMETKDFYKKGFCSAVVSRHPGIYLLVVEDFVRDLEQNIRASLSFSPYEEIGISGDVLVVREDGEPEVTIEEVIKLLA